MKIGVDIDGVIADIFPILRRELNEYFQKDITEIDQHNIAKMYDVTWPEVSDFFEARADRLFGAPELVNGAREAIQTLEKAGHKIFFITARRQGREQEITLKWLKQHGFPLDDVHCVGQHSKVDTVRLCGLDIFIEDSDRNAVEIAAQAGIPVCLLDTPYNQGQLPEPVIRCRDWPEILSVIDKYVKG